MRPVEASIAEHAALFKFAWVKEPSLLRDRGKELGLTDPHILEMSAWCMELHAQLAEVAEATQVDLLLMGGNGTALRLAAAEQRGSRDNDYLTTADSATIEGLMDALAGRFAGAFEAPLFRYRRIGPPPDAKPLPLLAYAVDVPALFDVNAPNGRLGIKIEFHLTAEAAFPESEVVQGEFLAVAEPVKAKVPKRPYQLVLKLMTLADPPVGIERHREDAIPRQLYDLDVLVTQIEDQQDWLTVKRYALVRFEEELMQAAHPGDADDFWRQVDRRLDSWSACGERASRYWSLVNQFQASQLASGSKRSSDDWRGRVRRLQCATRCFEMDAVGWQRWLRALEIESRLEIAPGAALKEQRNALSPVVGIPGKKQSPRPRTTFWTYLATAPNADQALERLDDATSRL